MKIEWWGYKHVNGTKYIKRYFSEEAIEDAKDSLLTAYTLGPIEADTKEMAIEILFPGEKK